MREKYNFHRNLVFMEYRVNGAPLEVRIPVFDNSVGRGYPSFVFQTVTRDRNSVPKSGLRDYYDPNDFSVVIANTLTGVLEDGDRITIFGRLLS